MPLTNNEFQDVWFHVPASSSRQASTRPALCSMSHTLTTVVAAMMSMKSIIRLTFGELFKVRWVASMGDNNSLGRTIRLLRKEKHLTQEQLTEGICSPVTISRIENGRQMPTKSVLDDLLSRLGTNIYQICDVYYTTERDNEFAEIIECADAALRRGNVDEARGLLDTVDEPSRERPPYRQLYLMMSARMLITPHGEHLDEALCLLEQSISLTRPSLCLNDFRHAFLSLNEAECIGLMIPTLCYLERYPDASRLGEELVRSMDNQSNKT